MNACLIFATLAFFSHCRAAAYSFCLLDLESESVTRAVMASYSKETYERSAEETVKLASVKRSSTDLLFTISSTGHRTADVSFI